MITSTGSGEKLFGAARCRIGVARTRQICFLSAFCIKHHLSDKGFVSLYYNEQTDEIAFVLQDEFTPGCFRLSRPGGTKNGRYFTPKTFFFASGLEGNIEFGYHDYKEIEIDGKKAFAIKVQRKKGHEKQVSNAGAGSFSHFENKLGSRTVDQISISIAYQVNYLAAFWKKNRLDGNKFATLLFDEANREVISVFSKERTPGCYSLSFPAGEGSCCCIYSESFFREHGLKGRVAFGRYDYRVVDMDGEKGFAFKVAPASRP
jgi:hypothetical protein